MKTKCLYTKAELENACEFFAPSLRQVYDAEQIFLPRWIDQAIVRAWVDGLSNLKHDYVLRMAYDDLTETGQFIRCDWDS